MKKLALKLDELQVESFDTASSGTAERGTVEGREDQRLAYDYESISCASCEGTCELSVCFGNTCRFSCNTCFGTCYACHTE